MKNILQLNTNKLLMVSMVFVILQLFSACKKETTLPTEGVNNVNAPIILNVTKLENRSTAISSATYGDWVIIRGINLATTNKVEFSDIAASDSLMYANDSSITVKIPSNLPNPADNPIKVTTKNGSTIFSFKILQPPPVISFFTPIAGPSGTNVTISGDYFLGVSSVKFNTTEAVIVSKTKTQIVATLPAGVSSAYIFITTPSGTIKSSVSFGLSYTIYEDALATGWSNTSYSAVPVFNNTTNVLRGTNSIKNNYSVGFGGFRIKQATASSLTGFTALKFSIFGGTNSSGFKVRIIVNGGSTTQTLTLPAAGTWTQYEIPFASLGNPTTLSTIEFKEYSGKIFEVYFDDIGLYKP